MQSNVSMRPSFRLGLLLPFILIAGCGKGEGPTPILGTPAPPPPPVTCDTVNFEDGCGPFDFVNFAGGVATVVVNPEPAGLNTSDKVARMQKFAAEPFGGSTLQLSERIEFSRGEAFKMKVWSRRPVPVLFKFEGLNRERTVSHSGSSDWEELCFSFAGDTAGSAPTGITFIFDLGVNGSAANDPANWTFYFDNIEQVASCGGAPVLAFPVGFEDAPASYGFADFAGGVAAVIANPGAGGINTSAQVARMQKFAGEVFGGSTLSLGSNVDFGLGAAFRMKVWSQRTVPVLFKFEGLNQERSANHSGGSAWQQLCFDFTGSTAGPPSNAITFIFDLGVAGNAAGDPNNWTFYFDDIEQVASCGGGGGGTTLGPVDFEPAGLGQGFTWAVFENGDNPAVAFLANPDPTGANTSATVARFTARQAGQPFAGTITTSLPTFTLNATNSCVKIKVWKTVLSDVGIKFETATQASTGEIRVANTVTNQWQELSFDFSGKIGEPSSTGIAGFILFPDFAARTQENVIYFDDIRFLAGTQCGGGGGGTTLGPVDFEPAGLGQGFTWAVFENGDNPPVAFLANPDATGANTSATVARFTARQAGQPFAGTVTSDLPTFTLNATNSCVKIKVWKTVLSDVGIKFETGTLASTGEIRVPNTVTNQWQELTFDFSVKIGEPSSTDITGFILFPDFAARTQENVVYFDDIRFLAGTQCGGGGGGGTAASVNFEGDPAQFDFGAGGGFGGGVSTVIANPASGGINTSAQVVQMEKFAGEVYGGSTLALPAGVTWSQGETFTMKVWSRRSVPVLFKLEGGGLRERSVTHAGGSAWQELCFDFTGATAGQPVTGFTIIFDLGVAGNVVADPNNWTFYYDDIQQTSGGCGGGGGGGGTTLGPVDFEPGGLGQAFAWTVFENGNNPPVTFPVNPDATGANTSATVARFTARLGGQPFAGTITSDLPTFTLNATNSCVKVKVWKSVISDVGIKFETGTQASTGEIRVPNTVTNQWQELTFDFSVKIGEPSSTDITGFILFPDFAARTQENVIYFDDIRFLADGQCP